MPDSRAVVYRTRLTTRFRGLDARDGVLLRGDAGWGEFSPFWDYDDAESASWLRAAHEAADDGWPAPVRDRVPVNVTVPAVEPDRARELVAASGGCRTAKVKVAQRGPDGTLEPLDAEVARLEAVRDALGPGGRVRVDANGAWDPEEALRRLPHLDRAAGGLEYVEQPCPDVAGLAAVRRGQRGDTAVPVAADESIRRAEDPLAVVRADAADVVVLKVQPLGGVRACLDLAEQVRLPVVVSSALESSVGIAAGVALAAALPALPYACGLATVNLFAADVVPAPLVPADGALLVTRPAPSAEALAATAPDPETDRRWRARLERVAGLVATGGAR
ncbi:O-succinylbenzoate synthase [Cellulosimicrobium aquatile]|uniref:o-succinylbenzoate synthase n=1 Tax=Cellulosimicrobium aquatile TaxID=1612203 RepID=A0A1N6N3K3_9MICO|nr:MULTISPECIES: o-succinylbenzoate synthase [Cellulosimicrobium]MCM3535748.1 o-succinylbenzoate synthase [Cellulosimicrobium funkei]MDQ8042521.1 o-succinylbenzoate synthase [Cellulosimicrobium sp. XJ-DQ-B-000]SIP86638.1 O-succinylbenzoate synthase [Cellulosimicrobium aquatile]